MKKKIIGLTVVALITLSPGGLQAESKMNAKRAKAYSSQLAKIDKTLSEAAGIVEKPQVNTKELQKTIKKLRRQERKIKKYDGKPVVQPQSGKTFIIVEVRGPNLDSEDDPVDYLSWGRLSSMLEYVVSDDYPLGVNKNYVLAEINSTKETIALKQKELKQAYGL